MKKKINEKEKKDLHIMTNITEEAIGLKRPASTDGDITHFLEEKKRAKTNKPKYREVLLDEVCTEGFEEQSDFTKLKFIVLHIRKVQQKPVKIYSASHVSKWNTAGPMQYDRILTAAEIGSGKGQCFCIIYQTQRESDSKLQKFKLEGCGVGDLGEILEPIYTKRNLGDSDMPILSHKWPLVPIKGVSMLLSQIPSVIYNEEDLPNSGTRFFLMTGLTIRLQNISMEQPICTGTMCDRQEGRSSTERTCACLTVSNRCAIVLSCNLFIKDKIEKKKTILSVRDFRSWNLTKMICGNTLPDTITKEDFNNDEVLVKLREDVTIIVDYVNYNGGWTIAGWFRVGLQQDAADKTLDYGKSLVDTVAAETVTPHVSRLIPTSVDVREIGNLRFRPVIESSIENIARTGTEYGNIQIMNPVEKTENTELQTTSTVAESFYCCNDNVTDQLFKQCHNCFRQEIGSSLNIEERLLCSYNLRKKLCSVRNRKQQNIWLCEACHITLLKETVVYNWSFIWPSYFWKLLSSNFEENIRCVIWKWIPKSWRGFWLYSVRSLPYLSLDQPISYFIDVSEDVEELEEDLKAMTLVKLKNTLNKYCYSGVKCPWGCDEFLEKCFYLPMYPLVQKLLSSEFPNVELPLSERSICYGVDDEKTNAERIFCGIRPDYLTARIFMLDNSSWPISPCLRMVANTGPMIMVCSQHETGSSLQYVHVPNHPIHDNLPSVVSPQLAQASIKPRTIRSLRLNRFSNTYQLVHTEGSYQGVDSCYLYDNEDFSNEMSKVAIDDEKLFLSQRSDMRFHLNYLRVSEQIPLYTMKEKLQCVRNNDMTQLLQSQKGLEGATYLTLFDALCMENEIQEEDRHSIKSTAPWPKALIHTYNSYHPSMTIPRIPPKVSHTQDCRLLWIILSLLLNNTILWSCFDRHAMKQNKEVWTGWLLQYLADYVGFRRFRKHTHHHYVRSKTLIQLMQCLLSVINDIETASSTSISDVFPFPNFCWDYILKLFNSLSNEIIIHEAENVSSVHDTMKQVWLNSVSYNFVGFLIKPQLDKDTKEFQQIHHRINEFELTNIVYINDSCLSTYPCDIMMWFRRVYVDSIDHFYRISSQNKQATVEFPVFSSFNGSFFLCYSRLFNLSDIQRNYLRSMGNESNSTCPVHNKSLISLPYLSKQHCCMKLPSQQRCHHAAVYQCPVRNCSFSLCKTHKDNTIDFVEDFIGMDPIIDEEPMNTSEQNLNELDEKSETSEDIFPDFLLNEAISECESVASVMSIEQEDIHAMVPSVYEYNDELNDREVDGINNPAHCNGSFENQTSESSDFFFDHLALPTTISTFSKCDVSTAFTHSVPLTVLLNQHLRVLIRRNHILKASKKMRGFLERIVANAPSDCIPLLFPESVLFPNIFYHQRFDGAIDGCIPSALWSVATINKHFGFASVEQHLRNRIMNSSLRCSTEPGYLFFAFDSICNAKSVKTNSQIVLARGFEHMLDNVAIHGFLEDATSSNTDVVDSRKTVLQLAAFLREHDPTYFYTHTCNTREHFGVAPLQRWVDQQVDQLRFSSYGASLSNIQFKQQIEALNQRLVVPITRSWYRAGKYFMDYICKSHEKPLGTIKAHWGRWEDNANEAALSHLHIILATLESKLHPVQLRQIQERVVCSSKKALHDSILQPLFEEGLLELSSEAINKYYDYIKIVQEHGDCGARHFRCHISDFSSISN